MRRTTSPARPRLGRPILLLLLMAFSGLLWAALSPGLPGGPSGADARSRAGITLTPRTLVAGGRLKVRVTGITAKRCELTVRRAVRGSKVLTRSTFRRGAVSIPVPASSQPGARVVRVRCGGRTLTGRYKVVAPANKGASAAPQPVSPAGVGPDDQGFFAGIDGPQDEVATESQLGGGPYSNAKIADIALSQLGRNLYTPGPIDHGQCKQAANDWVAAASGGTQRMGVDYHENYARNGGTQVSRDDAAKGDIIQLDNPGNTRQYFSGMHTAVVLGHAAGSESFDVVDANFRLDRTVTRHAYNPYAAARRYGLRVTIWRMGTVDTPAAPAPTTPAPSAPAPAPTYAETTGGATNTWTNHTNAGGNQGPTIPSNTTVQVACKLTGFRVADGNTWWYRIASGPWNGAYYASADAFYNNGATSGPLRGTPFVDNNVPNC